jgi:hypothetical protein
MAMVRGIGRRRHDQHVRRGAPLGAQRVALLDAEAVLLVDHDQPEVGEGHALRQQRVGADDDPGLPARGLARAVRRAAAPCEPVSSATRVATSAAPSSPACASGPEHRAQRAGVLLGEHLGRGQQRGLAAAVDDLQHRPQRHEGLAGADLALQEAVHRARLAQLRASVRPTSAWPA